MNNGTEYISVFTREELGHSEEILDKKTEAQQGKLKSCSSISDVRKHRWVFQLCCLQYPFSLRQSPFIICSCP